MLADVNSSVVEFTDGIGVVKAFGETGRASKAFRSAVERFTTFFLGWAGPLIRPETVANQVIGPVALLALSLGMGTWFVWLGWSDPVSVLAFALVGLGLSAPISALMASLQATQASQGAASRLSALLETPRMPVSSDPKRPSGTRLELEGVRFGYEKDTPILDGIDWSFSPGTVTAIRGRVRIGQVHSGEVAAALRGPRCRNGRFRGCAAQRDRSERSLLRDRGRLPGCAAVANVDRREHRPGRPGCGPFANPSRCEGRAHP